MAKKKKPGRKPVEPGMGDLRKQKIARRIDGEQWSVTGIASGRKDVAEKEAKALREKGIRARVIKTKSFGYTPYMNISDHDKYLKKQKRSGKRRGN